jgi:hypothetical protein
MIDKEQKLNTVTEHKAQLLHTQPSTSREANTYRQTSSYPAIQFNSGIQPTPATAPFTSKQHPQQQQQPKQQIKDRQSEIMKNWYPLRFKLNYPSKSALKLSEQKDFIDMCKKFLNRTHLSQKEVKTYKLYVVSI